jgi:hypothetical protein
MIFRRKTEKAFEMSAVSDKEPAVRFSDTQSESSADVHTNPGSTGLYASSPVGPLEDKRSSLKGGRASIGAAIGQAKDVANRRRSSFR